MDARFSMVVQMWRHNIIDTTMKAMGFLVSGNYPNLQNRKRKSVITERNLRVAKRGRELMNKCRDEGSFRAQLRARGHLCSTIQLTTLVSLSHCSAYKYLGEIN